MIEQVQILWIAEGRQHPTQIGGTVLQNKGKSYQLFLSRFMQDEPAQRQKGQQCGIVGQQHGSNQRDEHQCDHHAAAGMKRPHQLLGQYGKQSHPAQSADDCQNAEQTRQRFDIVIAYIRCVRRYETSGHSRRQHRDQRHGIGLAPGKNLHRLPFFAVKNQRLLPYHNLAKNTRG